MGLKRSPLAYELYHAYSMVGLLGCTCWEVLIALIVITFNLSHLCNCHYVIARKYTENVSLGILNIKIGMLS